MSKKFREMVGEDMPVVTSPEMRTFCSRPGKFDGNGKQIYRTEQHHKAQCDVNNIIKKYDKDGLITHVSKFEAKFGDHRGVDFQEAMNLVTSSSSMFADLPSHIRKRFGNSPGNLLEFMESPDNRDEAIKLGLINPDWTESTDGLGEHVPEGGNVLKEAGDPGDPPAKE